MDDDESSGSSPLRFRRAFEALTDEQLVKLEKVARVLSWKTKGELSQAELFNETVLRALDERRRWPHDVPFEAFFVQVMKSVAFHEKPRPTLDSSGPVGGCSSDVAERAVALIEMCRQHDDVEGEMVLLALADGANGPAVRKDLGLSQQDYDTIIKRVRRRAEREGLSYEGGE